MDIQNLPSCASVDSQFNTGQLLCDLIKGRIKGVLYADRGVSFSPTDLATAATALAAIKAKTTAPRGGRVYPIWDLLNFEDGTGDPGTGSVGNLSTATIVTNDAVPSFTFGYSGGELRNRRMSQMVGGTYDVFFIDDKFAMYGTADNSNGGIKGFTVLQNYVYASKFIISDAVNQYHFRMTLSSISEYRDQARFVVLNSGALNAVGLINFTLAEVSHASNVYKLSAIADGGTDLVALYSALATTTFTAKRLDTGAAVVVTSVARDTSTTPNTLTVTLDSTAFNALPSGTQVQISADTPANLATAGVKPYEGISVIIIKP